MNPATRPPTRRDDVRLLVLEPASGTVLDRRFADLPSLLAPGDVLVVNDAATLPGSLPAVTERFEPIEIRLVAPPDDRRRWQAVLFGAGDWRQRTEDRAAPPSLPPGAVVRFPGGLTATVAAVSPISPRLVGLELDGHADEWWAAIYAIGAPVQYAHLDDDLELWSVQTAYAGRPWAAEMPSAGRPLSWSLLAALRARGVTIARLTHAAGLSATGDPALDAALPLPERYDLPAETVAALSEATGRVIAVGTTVVRALEGCFATHGRLLAGIGETSLRLGPHHVRRVVAGIISGMHAPAESHYQLLRAFAGEETLLDGFHRAVRLGYRAHEFGDETLILGTDPRWTSSSATVSRPDRTDASTRRSRLRT
ncbi:MAG TPA: S-adenosylmethionine:tRNA ribosyltransferase-isomerase [Kofleriaceae bacterium]|nr:S-adenosylmethionine:tRNA ribosyltransferase-isomerase [Kofleriaceae bacterium]